MVDGPCIIITKKAPVDQILIRASTPWCKSVVGIDASHLFPFSMCQAMLTGLYTKWELDSESGKLKPHQKRIRSFENMAMSYF